MAIILMIAGMAMAPQPARWIATSLVGATAPAAAMILGSRTSMRVLEAPVAVVAPPPRPAKP